MARLPIPARTLGAASALLLAAASQPRALTAPGGEWELARAQGPAQPVRRCVANVAALAQHEHRTASCTSTVIRDSGATAVISYTCSGGGFGQAKMTVLTPRLMRVEVQGISSHQPFYYVLNARRVGDC